MNTLYIFLLAPILVKTIQFFIALSLLIIIHEFGHFLFAKLFKTRVEKFYLFFDFFFPFPSLMNFALFKKMFKGTEYGLGWFPLGGYVKIAGMVDESMDKEAMKLPPQPWEYRSKKSYQKLLIMLGGIIFNLILAFLIYVFIFAKYGEQYLPTQNAKYGIVADSLAQSIGFMNGDKIVEVGGKKSENFNHIVSDMIFNEAKDVTVDRNGEIKKILIPEGTVRHILKTKQKDLFAYRMPFEIDSVMAKGINDGLLKKGDRVIGINETMSPYLDVLQKEATAIKEKSKAEKYQVNYTVLRNNDTMKIAGFLNGNGKLEVGLVSPDKLLEFKSKDYTFLQAIPKGISYTGEQLMSYLGQLKLIFTSPEVKVSESLGGFGSIGSMFPAEFDLFKFLQLTAFISIILAFMNLLPIPGLDGGYVFFLLIEMISGRKISDNVIEKANTVGLVILLALMLYANGLDIFRMFQ